MDNFFTIAAMAPQEIPYWFKHEPAPDKPSEPLSRDLMPKEVRYKIDKWICLGRPVLNAEQSAELAEYINPLDYFKLLDRWKIKDQEARYFQWRIYYAKQIYFYDTLQNKALGPLFKDKNEQYTISTEADQRLLHATRYALDCLFKIKMDPSQKSGSLWADLAYQALQEAFINKTSPHHERRP